jgi:hypothetical protein
MAVGVSLPLLGRMGKLQQEIVIASNDPTTPHFLLTVKGEVK